MDRRSDRYFNPTRDHRFDEQEIHQDRRLRPRPYFEGHSGPEARGRYGMDRDFNRGYGAYDQRSYAGRGEGDFTGRGPKGYRRSDERIREDVCEILLRDPRVDAGDVEVSVQDQVVRLTGTIASRRMKRWMEDVIDHVPGVLDIRNEVQVRADAVRPPLADVMGFEEEETGWEVSTPRD
ncbi:MAG: BON domain-containing protein [Bdellovibrionaceae bacterium]|nr:BON domain-containing protein [Pseudobdellovibrionaceae bacterium]